MGIAASLGKSLHRFRFFEGGQVLALKVLDKRQLEPPPGIDRIWLGVSGHPLGVGNPGA